MKRKNILITGGAGFIGSHLTDELLARGHFVRVIDNLANGTKRNLESALKQPHFEFVEGDILDQGSLNLAMRDITIVYHLACLGVRHSLSNPIENHKVNAEGSLLTLETASKANVSHFYYVSTSEVYGLVNTFPISEESKTAPITVYGGSKLAGENYAVAYHKCFGLKTTVLRIFNNYGPRSHYEGNAGEVIPRSIVHSLYGKNPRIFGDGNITRDFFYVKDTSTVLSNLLDHNNLYGEVLNIGTGEEIKIKDLVGKILGLINNPSINIDYLDSRPADVPRLWVDNTKFKKLMNYKPKHSFDKGLAETIQYFEGLKTKENLLNAMPELNWKT